MKLFSASSSSSCSIYGVLRQLLCFNATTNLPESTIMNFQNSSDEKIGSNKENSPGIVAKLMGLESLPNTEVETATSRMKYAPTREGKDESLVGNFPYSPVFILEHDKEFIVISFEDENKRKDKVLIGSKSGKRRRKGKKCGGRKGRENHDPHKEGASIDDEKSCPEFLNENKIQELGGDFCNSKFGIKNGMGSSTKTAKLEENSNGRKQNKSLNSIKIEEQHSDFENSSPVSVLDTLPFDTDPRIEAKSGASLLETGGNLIHGYINPKKKLSIELGTYKESPPLEPIIDLQEKKIISSAEQKQQDGSRDKFWRMLEGICVLAQEDVIDSNGTYMDLWKLKEIEDISAEFEQQIMGDLLDELVDQLLALSL